MTTWSVWVVDSEGERCVRSGLNEWQAEKLVGKMVRYLKPGTTISMRESGGLLEMLKEAVKGREAGR